MDSGCLRYKKKAKGHSTKFKKSYLATFTRVDSIMESRSFIATHSTENLIISIKFWKWKKREIKILLNGGIFFGDISTKNYLGGKTRFMLYFLFLYTRHPPTHKKNDVNNPAFEGRQYILYVHIDGELCDGFSVNFEIGKIWHH